MIFLRSATSSCQTLVASAELGSQIRDAFSVSGLSWAGPSPRRLLKGKERLKCEVDASFSRR